MSDKTEVDTKEHFVIKCAMCGYDFLAAQRELTTLRAERDQFETYWKCAGSPLMAYVMQERDALRSDNREMGHTIERLQAEIAEKGAVIAKLPRTADGLIVLPDDRVWCVTDGGFGHLQEVRVTAITQQGWFTVGPHLANENIEDYGIPSASDHEDAPKFYSTREACISSQAATGGANAPA